MANSARSTCLGSISVPIQLVNTVKLLEILLVPEVLHTLILGIDFWKKMGIIPDLRSDVWHFSSKTKAELDQFGTSLLSNENLSKERKVLENLINSKVLNDTSSLECANGAVHHFELFLGTSLVPW